MYRQYENPYVVEKLLAEAIAELEEAKARRESDEDLISLYLEIEELRDRVRFAWDDDEYEENAW